MADTTIYGTKGLPYSEPDWKIPGYTGHIDGLQETYQQTPIMSQVEALAPNVDSFLHTRKTAPPAKMPERDPCNDGKILKKGQPDNIWPNYQLSAAQEASSIPRSSICVGDLRIQPFKTNYSTQFAAPFQNSRRIRSPMRNPDLAQAHKLLSHYHSSFNRVGAERLKKMIHSMSARLAAKLGNRNDNGFKLRRLFKMYDKDQTGKIQLEDLRVMMESFGIQLDDDSLLALYYSYDPEGTGYLEYEELMNALLDPDYFALYTDTVDNTQATVDKQVHKQMMNTIKDKFQAELDSMIKVFSSLDSTDSNYLPEKDFLSGCAALGVVLNDHEWNYVQSIIERNDQGEIDYKKFY